MQMILNAFQMNPGNRYKHANCEKYLDENNYSMLSKWTRRDRLIERDRDRDTHTHKDRDRDTERETDRTKRGIRRRRRILKMHNITNSRRQATFPNFIQLQNVRFAKIFLLNTSPRISPISWTSVWKKGWRCISKKSKQEKDHKTTQNQSCHNYESNNKLGKNQI